MNVLLQYFRSPFGELIVGVYDVQLCLLDFRYRKMRSQVDRRIQSMLGCDYEQQKHPLHETCMAELEAYWQQKRQTFSVPLMFVGSEFQQKVWQQLCKIPYGQLQSYGELAQAIGAPNAVRAVAAANGANAIAIIVPCHRVIGSDDTLTGYGGGLSLKKKLLQIEGHSILGDRVQRQQINLFD